MYAGLTISDKPALLEAKADGAEWVTLRKDGTLCKLYSESDVADFIHIPTALAQIAEMDSAEKQEEIGCEFCKHYAKPSVVIWDSHVLAMVGEDKPHKPFIKIELKARKNEAELVAVSQGLDNKQNSVVIPIRHCPNCGRNLASPYTEGATK